MLMRCTVSLSLAFVIAAGACGVAPAQDLGSLKGMAGGLDPSSLTAGTAGNAAGVIEYCMKNNFLGGGASGVKDQLMGKVNAGGESDKADYAEGAKGLLKTGDGKSVDIGKLGSMKQSATKKACSSVLDNAKSLL